MKAQVLTGSKQEIADRVKHIEGDVREVIVFVEAPPEARAASADSDIFAEMEQFTANANDVDYSREVIYSPVQGE